MKLYFLSILQLFLLFPQVPKCTIATWTWLQRIMPQSTIFSWRATWNKSISPMIKGSSTSELRIWISVLCSAWTTTSPMSSHNVSSMTFWSSLHPIHVFFSIFFHKPTYTKYKYFPWLLPNVTYVSEDLNFCTGQIFIYIFFFCLCVISILACFRPGSV